MSTRSLALVVTAVLACSGSHGERSPVVSHDDPPTPASGDLTLVVDLSQPMPLGNGTSWNAQVREVKRGTLADTSFHINLYDTTVPCCEPVQGLVLVLARDGERGAAQTMVAADGTVYKVISATR